jgi:hypothetical protein
MSTVPKVKANEEVEDAYPTHDNYIKMLHDHKTMIENNLIIVVNMIMSL